ncbi:DUF6851 domain-containing protein [Lunatibacter salilacus]|uniref:DUF6851 domain-containing protein n=1 Tax=Lunatibacter salilacus TaxID=2483804 RepID=UPI00131BFFC9|nr:T9SS type A sorting domain-containing protein [Lunatibacter salilacus]
MGIRVFIFITFLLASRECLGDHSIARRWNEALLQAIRNDFARPTVHARNLFHLSAGMYDTWVVYGSHGSPYFLGEQHGEYSFPYEKITLPKDVKVAREEALSYYCYRMIRFRFRNSPGWEKTFQLIDNLMDELGYDPQFTSEIYVEGRPAALGNYLAAKVIEFGLQDGSNEGGSYQNLEYAPINEPMVLRNPVIPEIVNPNRWQPLAFDTFIDQNGNVMTAGTPPFLSPEWGRVIPFSLNEEDLNIYQVNGMECLVYHDPGEPFFLNSENESISSAFKRNFTLVANWSSHLDPSDGVIWDISPGAMGNFDIHRTLGNDGLFELYLDQGGDVGTGYSLNPKTNQPYEPQLVPRGDYTRVLAEFWADGPSSETPPGHWFSLLNYVNDHPLFEKKFLGKGEVLDPLEWDIKSYFLLGGAMHDAAITAWGIKGYYDYVRPISAIRYMSYMGQSSDETLPNYHPEGMELMDGMVELVEPSDPLSGPEGENVGKIKLLAWKGHEYIETAEDQAGVGWVLGEEWWPYQRPTFVTPPFAGYVSGHSTFSRAAAKVMTLLTGDEYFPGGIAEFVAGKNEYLVFEEGPSVDVVLQWARYYDAADQCSLSRIWGGIHPPQDDLPARLIGETVGAEAFNFGVRYFEDVILGTNDDEWGQSVSFFPNPVVKGDELYLRFPTDRQDIDVSIWTIGGALVYEGNALTSQNQKLIFDTASFRSGIYVVKVTHKLDMVAKLIRVE